MFYFHKQQFGRACRDAKLIDMTPDLKKLIVDGHNQKRQLVYNGGIKHLRRPCKMAHMTWNEELAQLAALHAKRCQWEHDGCHPTSQFPYSGQNLHKTYTRASNPTFNIPEVLTSAIDGWFNEERDCTQNHINSYPMGGP